jgi:hypothetical protein
MPQYEVIHRLGCYIPGIGTRDKGGVFTVNAARAARFDLDNHPMLKRIDTKPKAKQKPKIKPAPLAPETKEA